jgi:hypothetical protein
VRSTDFHLPVVCVSAVLLFESIAQVQAFQPGSELTIRSEATVESIAEMPASTDVRAVYAEDAKLPLAGWKALVAKYPKVIYFVAGNTSFDDAAMQEAAKWKNLQHLFLNDTAITDRALEMLAANGDIVDLVISGSKVTDQGMEACRKILSQLRSIDISDTACGNRSIRLVADAAKKSIERIDAENCPITDEAVESLADCPKLSALFLRGTPITDKSLAVFEKMPSLKVIDLRETKTSADGVRELAKKRTRLKIRT